MSRLPAVVLLLAVTGHLAAQNRSAALLASARQHIAAREFEQADTDLSKALQSAAYVMDSTNALVWRGIFEYMRGSDSLARLNFRRALLLRQVVQINGLDQLSPGLADLFESEARGFRIYPASQLDEPVVWQSGPPVAYPAALGRRRVGGHALVTAVVDTLGHVEDQSIQVLEAPDSAFNEPLRQMMRAATFKPGRVKGQVVRSMVSMGFALNPPAPKNPTALVNAARDQLRARRPDSALALTEEALDSVNQATAGEEAYAYLVRGLALQAKRRDSLATASFHAGLARYYDLTSRGVDLAPFLKRLADSIHIGRRATARTSGFAALTVLGTVDEPPVLLSHPPIRYSPEMSKLGISGTVLVEATLDTTGRVVPASAKIIQSPNPAFNADTKGAVEASVYRPARIKGRAARVTIRQPVTFAAY